MDASTALETDAGRKLPSADKREKAIQQRKRAQWLRAAILGANDGLLSTASLMLGIGAAKDDQQSIIISGIAGALAGACSMAVGEFVSVSTQRDIEKMMTDKSSSDGNLHDLELVDNIKLQSSTPAYPSSVEPKLTAASSTPNKSPIVKLTSESQSSQGILSPSIHPGHCVSRVLTPSRSPMMKVMVTNGRATMANQYDVEEEKLPCPFKAAAASALAFLCGAVVPLVSAMAISQHITRIVVIIVVTSVALALFGGLGALLGGSSIRNSAIRVLVGGWISMALTYGLIKAFDHRDHKAHEG